MMVLGFDAVVADAAVVGAGGPPEVAGFAVFDWNFEGAVGCAGGADHEPVGGLGADGKEGCGGVGGWEGVDVAGEYLLGYVSCVIWRGRFKSWGVGLRRDLLGRRGERRICR